MGPYKCNIESVHQKELLATRINLIRCRKKMFTLLRLLLRSDGFNAISLTDCAPKSEDISNTNLINHCHL